jgi:hypothetical protein
MKKAKQMCKRIKHIDKEDKTGAKTGEQIGDETEAKSKDTINAESSPVRMTSKLQSKLKQVVSVGGGLWRMINGKGEYYYCTDPLLLVDTIVRRKYHLVEFNKLNSIYLHQYLITGRKICKKDKDATDKSI